MDEKELGLGIDLPHHMPIDKNAIKPVPQVVIERADEMSARDRTYIEKLNKSCDKAHAKVDSSFRIVADNILSNSMKEELSYSQVASQTGLSESVVYSVVKRLNFWKRYPLKFMPVRKKKGFFQLVTKSEIEYELYNQSMERHIAKKEEVRSQAEIHAWAKFGNKPHKQTIKVKQKQKQKKKEVEA